MKTKSTKRKKTARRRTSIQSRKGLREKVESYMIAEEKLLEKHGLAKRLIVTFPYHRVRVPLKGRIALRLLKWSRAVLDTQYGEIRKR
jgi:hypothetical protein